MTQENVAEDVKEVADFFDTLASDQIAMNARGYGTKRDQRDREVEARVWKEAAETLRNTKFTKMGYRDDF